MFHKGIRYRDYKNRETRARKIFSHKLSKINHHSTTKHLTRIIHVFLTQFFFWNFKTLWINTTFGLIFDKKFKKAVSKLTNLFESNPKIKNTYNKFAPEVCNFDWFNNIYMKNNYS